MHVTEGAYQAALKGETTYSPIAGIPELKQAIQDKFLRDNELVCLYEGVPVVVDTSAQTGFKVTPAALDAAITDKTKWLMLNSPGNPSGAVYSEEELKAIAAVLKKHPHVWVLSDDMYEHLIYTEDDQWHFQNQSVGGGNSVKWSAGLPSTESRNLSQTPVNCSGRLKRC